MRITPVGQFFTGSQSSRLLTSLSSEDANDGLSTVHPGIRGRSIIDNENTRSCIARDTRWFRLTVKRLL